jgi:hypothetical protein
LAKRCVYDAALRYYAASLVIDVCRVPNNASYFGSLSSAACSIGNVCFGAREQALFDVAASASLNGETLWPERSFSWIATHFECPLSTEGFLSPSSLLPLVEVSVPLWQILYQIRETRRELCGDIKLDAD